jgi:hypothetical protein
LSMLLLPPLSYWDVSLLLAVGSIVFLITIEFTSPYYGRTNLVLNRKKLRNVTLLVSILFLITVGVKIISTFIP